jgi:glutaconyl-CoA decarboxylase
MVRKYRVTVAGQTYEVEVEELGSGGAAVRSAERVVPQAAVTSSHAAPSAAAAHSAPEHAARPAARGGIVSSPLPGKVLAVRGASGGGPAPDRAKNGKRDFCARGTVRKVHVTSGQNVETGDPLAELAPGD